MRVIEAALLCAVLAALGGCAPGRPPLRSLPMPEDAATREAAADALGRALFDALRAGGVSSLLAGPRARDAIFVTSARARVLQEQAHTRSRFPGTPWARQWGDHDYAGVCLQGDRLQGAALGLRAPAWVVDRVLVVARRGTWESAAWVTGTFVLTSEGFQTIAVSQIQPPRAGHADLELTPCDVQRGL